MLTAAAVALLTLGAAARAPSGYTVVGWNNLGMHCTYADYSVFSILPPYNVLNAQVIGPDGAVVTNGATVRVTYQAVADPAGSMNTTSKGKTNFWQFVQPFYGATPAEDVGSAGAAVPGTRNTPQAMAFDSTKRWFVAEGLPITAYDDAGHKNPYPMMRVIARDAAGAELARTDVRAAGLRRDGLQRVSRLQHARCGTPIGRLNQPPRQADRLSRKHSSAP